MSHPASHDEPLIVSVSGLRGVVGATLTPEVAVRYVHSFAATLPPGPVVVGRDGRQSGPMLAAAIASHLTALGRDVVDCGAAATPTIGVVVRDRAAAGGVQISASHNPARYNGLKLFSAAGCVDVEAIRRRRPKVWLDSGHGAGSRAARPLLEHLGCEVVIEGGTPDGLFEHEPEPTAVNLAGLLPKIAACGADVGFFQDPDADRLAIATAAGHYIGEEATLALAVEAVLTRNPGPVVVNCSTSGMTAAIAKRLGVPCHVSKVGEANVVDEMLARGAVLGGEGNGGVIDPRVVLVRDSFIAMALVLERLAVEATTVERLAAALPAMVMKKTKVDLSPELRGAGLASGLARIEAAFPEASASRLDGLRLDWPGGWLLVRASNTEPIVRIVAEAGDDAAVDAAIARAATALG